MSTLTGPKISVVTPTYLRPQEVGELLANLSRQTVRPWETLIVDCAPAGEDATEKVVAEMAPKAPFECIYFRHARGTAVQRNAGIDRARGEFVAFIDDDVRLEPDFFERILEAFAQDPEGRVGAVAGYITNQYLDPARSPRWRWYRRLRLFATFQPGKYDYSTGYPINRYLQAPHESIKPIDFMGSNCAVWRREVFSAGLRFSPFFADYGILEDAHLALSAGREWTLWEYGRAHCVHLHSPRGRTNTRRVAWKTAVNYRFVFLDIVPNRSWRQETRFWTVQAVDLVRLLAHALRTPRTDCWMSVLGKCEGILAALRMTNSWKALQAPGLAGTAPKLP